MIADAHQLKCQYKRHHPLFYYGPLREETLFSNPWIVLYHDLMTDSEVAAIKRIAKPKVSENNLFIQEKLTNRTEFKRTLVVSQGNLVVVSVPQSRRKQTRQT